MTDKLVKATRDQKVRHVVLSAAARPTNLGVLGLGTAVTAGLALAGLPFVGVAVLGLGALAYGAMVLMDANDPDFVKKSLGLDDDVTEVIYLDRRFEPPIDLDDIRSEEHRARYRAIIDNVESIRGSVRSSTDPVARDSLIGTYQRCVQLARDAGVVALRGNELSRYLTEVDIKSVEGEVYVLEQDAKRTKDERAAEGFHKAAAAKRAQLQTREQIAGLYDRIQAQLIVIESTLDGIQAKVIKVNATDLQEVAEVSSSISDQLDGLSTDIEVLETAVDETVKELTA